MKTINLPAFGRVTMDEVNGLLLWLAKQATTDINLARLGKNMPLRTSELKPALKVLEQLGFITTKDTRLSISVSGLAYLGSDAPARVSIVRGLFARVDWVQTLLGRLDSAPGGRLPKSAINEAINAHSSGVVAESEVLGFIDWAESCELFIYDEKRHEIIRLGSRTPRDPQPVAPESPRAA